MGRGPAAEPVRAALLPPHDGARHAGLDGGAHDRRGRRPWGDAADRDARFLQEPRFCARRLQGAQADAARLGPAASPAHSAERRPHDRIGLAAGGLFAPGLRARYARVRPAREQMPARPRKEMTAMRRSVIIGTLIVLGLAQPAAAATAYVSNEKGNTISVIDKIGRA